jgi:hypothetical protein
MSRSHALLAVLSLALAGAAQADTLTIPTGALMDVRVAQTLRSDEAREGDVFQATMLEPVIVDGRIVVPVGSSLDGIVSLVRSPAQGHRSGVLGLRFTRLHVAGGGGDYALDATLVGFRRGPSPIRDAERLPTGRQRAVVVIGSDEGPGKRPSSLIGNPGEDEGTLGDRWSKSGLSPDIAEIAAGAELTIELRRPLRVPAASE